MPFQALYIDSFISSKPRHSVRSFVRFVRSFASLFSAKKETKKEKRKCGIFTIFSAMLLLWLLFVYGMCAYGCERTVFIHTYIYIASVCVCMHRICVCGNMSVHKECEHICYSWVWVEFTIFRWNMSKTGRCAFKCVYVIIHLCMCMCLCTSMCICVFRFLFYPNVGLFFLSGTIERVRQN